MARRELASTQYYEMFQETGSSVVWMVRNEVPLASLTDNAASWRTLISRSRRSYKGHGLVIDIRSARGRSDPEFDHQTKEFCAELFPHYNRVAILVASAVGRLSASRLARHEAVPVLTTQDQEAAVRFAQDGDAVLDR